MIERTQEGKTWALGVWGRTDGYKEDDGKIGVEGRMEEKKRTEKDVVEG